ncbi:MAG: preprotein translocase subunit SecA [Magnetococcales bacterium]|nr:preprotein translocase subunit SecA [Magnetococcales bacterium]
MVMNPLKKIFGSRNERMLRSLQPLVDQINALEPTIEKLTKDELRQKTSEFKSRLEKGETLDDMLVEAFAVAREAARRALGLRPYDVQLIGAMVMHKGMISEMKTGEGKTLVAPLEAYLNALDGKGVHVVTVNDYLARRDAEWMRPMFETLDMTCGFVIPGLSDEERRAAYHSDVTYATNNEPGFDYLRDNMKFSLKEMVQRDKSFAIVDEVDSILIDEARTPLIISGPTEDRTETYMAVDKIIPSLKEELHWIKDEKARNVTLTEEGTDYAEKLLKDNGILEGESLYDVTNVALVHHLNQALKAHTLFTRDKDYIIKDDQVVIIDEFTGRMMAGRRFSEGLHQALEAKEGVKVHNENQTLAAITFQNYFRMYDKLAGMTGKADTEAEEFESIYGLSVVIIPTNLPIAREDAVDLIYRTLPEKTNAIIDDIADCAERQQPVLVGTTSIEKSEQLSAELKKRKVKHSVLNARYHEQEAEIVAQAGRLGAVTIATNMAGRGTDIKLGGSLELMLEGVEDKKEQDKLAKEHEAEKQAVLKAGGLRVIGTERHESRRIDNQLRGRSGRQGDPGSSQFYLCLQDDLMRIFSSNMDTIMERLNMPEGEAISNRLVSRALESAQRKIEARNFDIRKNLLKFDDVHNEQRKVIYDQRREVMGSEEVSDIISDFREDVLDALIARFMPAGSYAEQWEIKGLSEELLRIFQVNPPVADWVKEDNITEAEIFEKLRDYTTDAYAEKEKRFGSELLRRLEKSLLLQVIDQQWKDHLQRLDFLREGIGLRGFAQKDPLNEYKTESFSMFEVMLDHIREETIMLLSLVEVRENSMPQALPGEDGFETHEGETTEGTEYVGEETNPYAGQNIGRNQACPCGSGKKYKHCHGRFQSQDSQAAQA